MDYFNKNFDFRHVQGHVVLYKRTCIIHQCIDSSLHYNCVCKTFMCLCVESASMILFRPCKLCQSESTCIYVNYCKLIGWNEQFTCAHDL